MRFPALSARFCRRLHILLTVILAIFLLSVSLIQPVHAQTVSSGFNAPNTDLNVPHNQHYYTQSVMIEVLSTLVCQLAGIDPINPKSPCLGVNPITHKLGLPTADTLNGTPKVGGLLGETSGMIAGLYRPTTSTLGYFDYLSRNFGIVKPAFAATAPCTQSGAQGVGYGFCSLQPLIQLWSTARDIAYFLFVVAFMLIGLGIMLRVKIDPRTVMTIQNQIPRIIICILLVTFSYAIAAIMIDAMWLVTYIGINELTGVAGIPDLATRATPNLLTPPLSFADKVFSNGIAGLAWDISGALSVLIDTIIVQTLSHGGTIDTNCGLFNFTACLNSVLLFVTHIIMLLIVIVTIVMTLFKLWFDLLKAYTYVLIYVISAPLWIVMGLLPGKPLGFEKWLRSLFVNLATFPAVALMILLARIFLDLFNNNPNPQQNFVPPLVGQPNMQNFGALIAFGVLLMTPTILTMLREALKVPGNKHGAAIGAGLAAGAAVPGAFANRTVSNLNKRSQTGEALGPLARLSDTAGNKALKLGAKIIPGLKGTVARREEYQKYGTLRDLETHQKDAKNLDKTGFANARAAAQKAGRPVYENNQKGFSQWQKDKKIGDKAGALEEKAESLEFSGGRIARARAKRVRNKATNLRRRLDSPPTRQGGGDGQGGNGGTPGAGAAGVPRVPQSPTQGPGVGAAAQIPMDNGEQLPQIPGRSAKENATSAKEANDIHAMAYTERQKRMQKADDVIHNMLRTLIHVPGETDGRAEAFIKSQAARENQNQPWNDKKLNELTEEQDKAFIAKLSELQQKYKQKP